MNLGLGSASLKAIKQITPRVKSTLSSMESQIKSDYTKLVPPEANAVVKSLKNDVVEGTKASKTVSTSINTLNDLKSKTDVTGMISEATRGSVNIEDYTATIKTLSNYGIDIKDFYERR